MDRFAEIKRTILDHAEKDEAICAVVAIGSSSRTEVKADEYSDLDLFIVTTDRGNGGIYISGAGEGLRICVSEIVIPCHPERSEGSYMNRRILRSERHRIVRKLGVEP